VVVGDACTPDSLAVDDTSIYWVSLCNGGSINSISKTTGVRTVLVSSEPQAWAIAIDSDSVYWEHVDTIVKVAKSGGTPIVLASGVASPDGQPKTLLVDDLAVYWSNAGDDALMTVPKDGGAPPRRIATSSCIPIPALTSNYLYWLDCSTFYRQPLGGSSVERLVDLGASSIDDFVVTDAALVYWIKAPDGTDSLYSIGTTTAGAPTLIDGDVATGSVAITDGTFAYWWQGNAIVRESINGGGAGTVVDVSASGFVFDMAGDARDVYWVDQRANAIYKAAK
jgi:hypothetical protein